MRNMVGACMVLFLVGCGGSNSTGGGGGGGGDMAMAGGGGGCMGTLSGALSGSFSDCDVVAGYDSGSNQSTFEISVNDPPASTTAVTFAAMPMGMLSSGGSFSDTDASARGSMTITTPSGTAAWDATVGGSDPHQGSYTVHLTSVTTQAGSAATNALYDVHGSLSATLVPTTGSTAMGNVTVSVTF